MITTDKVTEIFCVLDEFCKNLDAELTKNLHIAPIDEGNKRMRNRKGQMSKSEIMTIWKSHTNLTHPGKYFRPSKVKIMRPTSPK